LQDIFDNLVKYVHDGSETTSDNVTFEIVVRRSDSMISDQSIINDDHHKNQYTYRMPILIRPKNDAPRIYLPNGPKIRLAHNSRLPLTEKLVSVLDSDNAPIDLQVQYSMLVTVTLYI